MVFRITGAHDPKVQLEFEVPMADGKVLEFVVPKLQYLPTAKSELFAKWVEENLDSEAKSDVLSTKKLLELSTSAAAFKVLDKLTAGEIREIGDYWQEQSKITPGESSASDDS